ncbi:MAG: Transcriptional regulator, TetR family [Hydrogenibacillus schlegelii]|uniref:Transcriptional regulator, TetR family n=2 Tax=Hydrogenibacillus schlegelii TaxID=1484 RepID=A0A2T5GEE6_HYDSH|nr:TetR/AcrR family transcriptional regulator [Hydrogenibacillus schlegelii]PTQ54535.1 MAG: Transcriptional regulator, TetR family [Hydrogenibacillus schlegelii]
MSGPKDIPTFVKDERLVEMRREQIVRAAVRLFIEKGFHRTTTREIAQASRFSIGTLYEYISSKEDVLYLVCYDINARMREGLEPLEALEAPPEALLRLAIERLIRVVDAMDDEVLLIYQESKSLLPEALKDVLRREAEIVAFFARLLRAGRAQGVFRIAEEDIDLMAENIVVLAEMWAFRRWALRKQYSIERFIATQTRLLLGELGVPAESGRPAEGRPAAAGPSDVRSAED